VAAVATEREDESSKSRDPILREIQEAAKADDEYQELVKATIEGESYPPGFKSFGESLTVDEGLVVHGARIVVPRKMRREVLKRLHSHQGIERTLRRARQTVFWPGISSDIKSTVEACEPCRYFRPSQQKEPMECDPPPTRVFQELAADFFKTHGKHFLVMADRFSGFPLAASFTQAPTAGTTIRTLRYTFAQYSCPERFFSDGGLQFTAQETQDFLLRWGVAHRLSSAGYAQSNGLAEATVKAVKHLLEKCKGKESDEFYEGMLELRNTPRAGGKSPAELVFGHPMRSRVPAHWKSYNKKWLVSMDDYDAKTAERQIKAKEHYNKSSKALAPLNIGDNVAIQNFASKRWDRAGIVVFKGKKRDYQVKMPSGRAVWRNRRFLIPIPGEKSQPGTVPEGEERGDEVLRQEHGSRRSKRVRFLQDV